jgi:hypothetical protein
MSASCADDACFVATVCLPERTSNVVYIRHSPVDDSPLLTLLRKRRRSGPDRHRRPFPLYPGQFPTPRLLLSTPTTCGSKRRDGMFTPSRDDGFSRPKEQDHGRDRYHREAVEHGGAARDAEGLFRSAEELREAFSRRRPKSSSGVENALRDEALSLVRDDEARIRSQDCAFAGTARRP